MAGILLRSITPKPGAMFDLSKFDSDAAKILNKTRDEIEKDFNSVVATWNDKPVFRGKQATSDSLISRMWGDKNTWIWANRGTRPHLITAKKAPALRFQTGYRRKTTPGKLSSRPGGARGPFRSAKSVMHPGTEAGDYDKASAEKQAPILADNLVEAIKKAAK